MIFFILLNDNALNLSVEFYNLYVQNTTQLTFTCSKSTIETPEEGVKYVQC